MSMPAMQPPPAPPTARKGGVALWALILGLVAILIAFIPFGAFFGWIPGIAAIVLAIVALVRRTSRRAFAVIGLVLAVLGAPISGGVTAGAIGGAVVQAGADASEQTPDAAKVAATAETTEEPAAPATTSASTEAANTKVAVPAVVGLAGNDARDQLEEAGFDVDWSQLVIIASNWKVTKQSATEATKGATILLTVKPKPEEKPKTATLHAVFKVWGTGYPDVTYSTDSDNIEGKIGQRYVMKVSDDALYYAVTAQLQGSGDIHCSVTINGVTRKGHASGGYNICSAQLSSSPFSTGGWD